MGKKKHIFLIGPSGVGKTSVALVVAELLGRPFIDLDDAITRKVGMSIHDYFAQYGQAKFRDREREILSSLCQLEEPHVYATGGGSVLDTRNVVEMRNSGSVVYLSALEEDIIQRVKDDHTNLRPLLEGDIELKVYEQYRTRRECYEIAADIEIATSRRDIQTVAEAVVRQTQRLSGENKDKISSIVVGDNILSQVGDYTKAYSSAIIISQESIPQQYRNHIENSIITAGCNIVNIFVPEGEQAKSFLSYESVLNNISQQKVTRNSVVVGVGGGVVGDISGFVAASYHRGLDLIHVPTTLLAQVDSSIGGKCGINLETGKNLVGAFHQPKVIIADIHTLSSLSDADFLSGLGEVVKYALLGNSRVGDLIREHFHEILERNPAKLVPLIHSCMDQKLDVVAQDPFEKIGIRATLNLGHTLAHAIETETQYSIPHGEAVALGLRFIVELSYALDRISDRTRDSSIELIDIFGLRSEVPEQCRYPNKLIEHMYRDKKSDGGLSMVLLTETRGAELIHNIDLDIVENVLTKFLG